MLNQLQIKSTASAATATVSHKPVEAKVSQVFIERVFLSADVSFVLRMKEC